MRLLNAAPVEDIALIDSAANDDITISMIHLAQGVVQAVATVDGAVATGCCVPPLASMTSLGYRIIETDNIVDRTMQLFDVGVKPAYCSFLRVAAGTREASLMTLSSRSPEADQRKMRVRWRGRLGVMDVFGTLEGVPELLDSVLMRLRALLGVWPKEQLIVAGLVFASVCGLIRVPPALASLFPGSRRGFVWRGVPMLVWRWVPTSGAFFSVSTCGVTDRRLISIRLLRLAAVALLECCISTFAPVVVAVMAGMAGGVSTGALGPVASWGDS